MSKPIKMYRNQTSHERLIYNAMYSLTELSIILGINRSTLSNRLQCVQVLQDRHIRPLDKTQSSNHRHETHLYDRLETAADKLSQEFLRRPLI